MVIGGNLLFGRCIPAHDLAHLAHRTNVVFGHDALQGFDYIAYLDRLGNGIPQVNVWFKPLTSALIMAFFERL